MATALQLEAEIAGEERAIRHLIGERRAISGKLARLEAHEKLLDGQLHRITTRGHPAVKPRELGEVIPHGERFFDVSSYQPHVDLAAAHIAASVRVGLLGVTKLTEGEGWTDAYGTLRLRQMADVGFPHRGAYHFFHPSESAEAQADHFLAAAHEGGVEIRETDVLICDAEVSDGEPGRVVSSAVRAFGQRLRQQTKAKLWLYGGGPFLREFGVTLDGYDAHWLAAYVGDPWSYAVFGRERTVAWQYTDGRYGPVPHVCPGIGPCDMSIIL